MAILRPFSKSDIDTFRLGAIGAGAVIQESPLEPSGYFNIGESIGSPGSYTTMMFPEGIEGAHMLDAAYPGAIQTPEGQHQDLKDFYQMLKDSERACVEVHAAKFKTGIFGKRYIADLTIMCGDSFAPGKELGSFYLGAAGADSQAEVWDQIRKLFDEYQELPYEDTKTAVKG